MGDLGAKVGERIAELVVRATSLSRERATDHIVRTAMAAQEDFFRLTGSEVERTIGPLWGRVAAHPDAPEWFRDTAGFVATGKGQWKTLLAGAATGMVMGGGIMGLVTNELQPVIGPMIGSNPHGIFAPVDAAILVSRGLADRGQMVDDAAQGGINADRFTQLVAVNSTYLTLSEVLILLNRGLIDEDFARKLLTLAGYPHDTQELALPLRHMPLSADTVASMWTRSIVSTEEGAAIAAETGVSREDFVRLTELYGMPPAPEILYLAYRRGIIDRDRLQRGVVQGPIRNEWFDVLEATQFHSMTPDQAASAVTQGHLSVQRGQEIAKEYGLHPDDFVTLIETAGLPPGVEFASEAYNRGFITDDEFGAMFLESRIKNRYLPLLRTMRTRLLPQETARSLLAKGVITRERTMATLLGHGFSPEDAEALIAGSLVEKGQAARDLSQATTLALYEEQEITPEDALGMLEALGYDESEAQLLLLLTDAKRLRTYTNAVITKVRAGVVKGLLDQEEAVTTLDALGVPPTRRAALLEIWDIERTTVTRDLTPAQIVQAAKKTADLMPPQAALSRLIGQGYAESDARILLRISGVQV